MNLVGAFLLGIPHDSMISRYFSAKARQSGTDQAVAHHSHPSHTLSW